MGAIYRALDTRLERTVALKVLRPETLDDPDRKRRFAREARAASALNHPNIVTIYDIDSDGGVDFIAMEHVEGESLQRRIAEPRVPLDEVLRYARGIAEALAAAHAAGIVHRDVKPANVMVTRSGQVKVLDFGLAKVAGPSAPDGETSTRSLSLQTQEGVVLGTVAYMSPEQAEGRAVDARSDVFSFGVLLFEMLCGRRPFQGSSVATLISAILRDPPPAARRLRPDAPPDLERVVDASRRSLRSGTPPPGSWPRRSGSARSALGRSGRASTCAGRSSRPCWGLLSWASASSPGSGCEAPAHAGPERRRCPRSLA